MHLIISIELHSFISYVSSNRLFEKYTIIGQLGSLCKEILAFKFSVQFKPSIVLMADMERLSSSLIFLLAPKLTCKKHVLWRYFLLKFNVHLSAIITATCKRKHIFCIKDSLSLPRPITTSLNNFMKTSLQQKSNKCPLNTSVAVYSFNILGPNS